MSKAKVWTVRELAMRWHVSVRTVQRWMATGELAAVHLGPRAVRVTDVERRRFEDAVGGVGGASSSA